MSTPPEASPELAQLLRGDGLAWAQRIRQRALPEHIARLLRRQALWPPGIHGLSLVRRKRLPLVSAEPLADLARLLPGERPPLERELPLAQMLPPSLAGLGEELAAGGETALAEGTAGLSALRQGAEGVAQSTTARVRQALQRAEGTVSPRSTGLVSAAQRAVERARQVQVPRGSRLVEELPAALRPLAQTAQGAMERAQETTAALPSLGEALPEPLASLASEATPERLAPLAGETLPAQAAPIMGAAREMLGEAATLPETAREALASAARQIPEGGLTSALRTITTSGLRERAGALLQRATAALRRPLPGGAGELLRRIRGAVPIPSGTEAPQVPGGPAGAQALTERAPASLAEGLARAVSAPAEAESSLAGITAALKQQHELAAPPEQQAQAALREVAGRLQGAAESLLPQEAAPRAAEAARRLLPRARGALARWLAPLAKERPSQREIGPPAPPQELLPAPEGAELLGLGARETPSTEGEAQAPPEEASPAALPAEEAWPLQGIPLGEALFGREAGAPGPAEAEGSPSTLATSLAERAIPGLKRALPALRVDLVRRGAEGAPQGKEGPTGEAPRPGPAGGGGLDLDELAEQVYRRIRERLRIERERSGPLH